MRVNIDAFDVGAFLYFFLAVTGAIFLITAYAGAQDEILPQNAPEVQTKAIHIMTAEERSTILINDIWKLPELEQVKISQGAVLSKRTVSDTPIGPYGWQAFVSQDAIGSWRGGAEAMAYGGL